MEKSKVKLVKFTPLALYQPDPENEENYFKLVWSSRNEYPRMTVYLDNTKKPDGAPFNYESMIIAPFSATIAQTFIANFENILEGDNDRKLGIECFNSVFKNGEKVKGEIALQAKAIVGKDKEGVMYLAAIIDGRRKAKIEIMPDTRFYKFLDDKGVVITDKPTLSVIHAKAYLKVLTNLLNASAVTEGSVSEMKEPPKYKTTEGKKSTPIPEANDTAGIEGLDGLY